MLCGQPVEFFPVPFTTGESNMQDDTKLIEFIKADLARGKVTGNLGFTDDLIESEILDSLGIMKLILFLENNYSVKISDDDLTLENFSSIMSINSLIEKKRP
jgi:methoxymalonate biosynthesis acyl carrier protein